MTRFFHRNPFFIETLHLGHERMSYLSRACFLRCVRIPVRDKYAKQATLVQILWQRKNFCFDFFHFFFVRIICSFLLLLFSAVMKLLTICQSLSWISLTSSLCDRTEERSRMFSCVHQTITHSFWIKSIFFHKFSENFFFSMSTKRAIQATH